MSILHVEVVQKNQSNLNKDCIKTLVHSLLLTQKCVVPGTTITVEDTPDFSDLKTHVQSITFCDSGHESELLVSDVELIFHIYKLDRFGAQTDNMMDDTSESEVSASEVWSLPSEEFYGLWESLVYDTELKEEILKFVETAFRFVKQGVDPKLIGWNRVVLLHGPPGTGKTSLCRALAQKLAIRFSDSYPRARLFEVNGHGLFSKWFSESGKLVAKLFTRLREVVEDKKAFVCVLVDEIESLAHARTASLAGMEPSDSVRAVNALLTQLDQLKRYPNVLVLTTSNVTSAIDVAFVDRADIKRLVGPPSQRAAYEILLGCCNELMARGLIAPHEHLFSARVLAASGFKESEAAYTSLRLWKVAQRASEAQLSGRALRRLPFLACALNHDLRYDGQSCTVESFIGALSSALYHDLEESQRLGLQELKS